MGSRLARRRLSAGLGLAWRANPPRKPECDYPGHLGSTTVVDPLMKCIAAALGQWLPLVAVFAGLIAGTPACQAQHADPGCLGSDTQPQYPPLNSPPTVETRHTEGDSGAPVGAACFSPSRSAALWITVASIVRSDESFRMRSCADSVPSRNYSPRSIGQPRIRNGARW